MPSEVPIKLNEIAARLLAAESRLSGRPSAAGEAHVFKVCEKLRGALSQLTGVGGFRSLLSRALALAGGEAPCLRELRVMPDGSLEGVETLKANLDREALALGEVALVARLLELLVTFIGPGLTHRLVQDIWPKLENLNFEPENGDERK